MTIGAPSPLLAELNTHPTLPDAAGEPADAIGALPGVDAAMLAALNAGGIHTVEDLAACATDDLIGWTERAGEAVTIHPGILGDLILSRAECDAIILRARIRAGWIDAAALAS